MPTKALHREATFFTRSRTHSLNRSPLPYSSRNIRPIGWSLSAPRASACYAGRRDVCQPRLINLKHLPIKK